MTSEQFNSIQEGCDAGCASFYGVPSYQCGYDGITVAASIVEAVHRGCTRS
jgi:hypothetical protein